MPADTVIVSDRIYFSFITTLFCSTRCWWCPLAMNRAHEDKLIPAIAARDIALAQLLTQRLRGEAWGAAFRMSHRTSNSISHALTNSAAVFLHRTNEPPAR